MLIWSGSDEDVNGDGNGGGGGTIETVNAVTKGVVARRNLCIAATITRN
jgi:hypothetical protein